MPDSVVPPSLIAPVIFRPMPLAVETAPATVPVTAPVTAPVDRLAELVAAGVAASRVNSPDLIGQLRAAAAGTPGDTVVCCLLDTDPSVPLNGSIAEAWPAELGAGIERLTAVARAGGAVLVVDPQRPFARMGSVRAWVGPKLRLGYLPGDYPQADPTLLLYSLLDRRLPPGRLPTDRGVVLVDAAAAVAVGHVALHGSLPPRVPVAVRDHFAAATHLLDVPVGTSLADVAAFVGVPTGRATFRAGEFLRDGWTAADAPVTVAGERMLHASARPLGANPDPCVRCGWCVEACPTRVHPAGLLDAAQRSDPAAAARHGLSGCIECGICSYVCPTRLPLLSAIRTLRVADPARHG